MKHVLIGIVVVTVLAVAILGFEKTRSYLTGTRTVINEEVDSRSPMRLESARIKSLMDIESEKVLQYEDKISDLQGRAEVTNRIINDLGKKLDYERQLLARIKTMLDAKQDKYTIGTNTYTFAEVSKDALARVDSCKKMEEDLEFQKSLVRDLRQAAEHGRVSLADARKKQSELKNTIVRLEARNVNADVRLEVAKLTSAVSGPGIGANSELEKAFQNYERRVAEKEHRAAARLVEANTSHLIDYENNVVTKDAASEIDLFLNKPVSASNEVPISTGKPAPSEAIQEKTSN